MSLCPMANPFVGVVVWALPRFLCVLLFLLLRRNANLAGGFAGRFGFGGLFDLCLMICPFHGPYVSLYKTAFPCLRYCKDRALVRHRPNRRKKMLLRH